MISTRVCDILHALVRAGIWGDPVPAELLSGTSAEEWQQVFDLSVRQSVVAVAYDGIPAGAVDDAVLLELWRGGVVEIERRNARVAAVEQKQSLTWEKHGLHPYVLKGSRCAGLYPKPDHRQSGDIDWCFQSGAEWDKALEIVRSNGLEVHWDSDGDFSYELAGVVVEHHRKGLPEMSPEGVVCYLVDHVFHHFSTSGVGIRQVCDTALAYEKLGCDEEKLRRLLRRKGLYRFWGEVGKAALGEHNRLWYMMMEDGNFGLGKKRRFNAMLPRTLLCLRYAPSAFLRRWGGLFAGRIRRGIIAK